MDHKMGQRVVTAIFFVLVMLGGVLAGWWSFALLFGLINAMCLWEFWGFLLPHGEKGSLPRKAIALLPGLSPYGFSLAVQTGLLPYSAGQWLGAGLIFLVVLFALFLFELSMRSEHPFHNLAFIVLGIVYIGVPFALLPLLAFRSGDYYPFTVLGLLLLTWSNDTFAYFSGYFFGKTPLFPRISPKKTWEGTAGGALITLALSYPISLVMGGPAPLHWLGLTAVVIVFGSLGDLVESMLKRSLHVKDSGHVLPGHGGFLDRFDAFIYMLPYATSYWMFVGS